MSYFDNIESIDVWFEKRRSKFTSSENYKLLPNDKQSKDQLWSTTASTYIETKVIELTTKFFERPELEEVESLLHGKMYELPAFERYVFETKNSSITYIGSDNPIFMPDANMPQESGGTPDAADINNAGKVDYLTEIKCPKNPAYHFRRLSWSTQWDILEGYKSCYTQMQHLMMVTGAKGCDFVSYDERQLARAKQIKIIQVKPDLKFQNNLEIRIQLAVKEKYKLLSKHMGVELKNKQDFINFINQ